MRSLLDQCRKFGHKVKIYSYVLLCIIAHRKVVHSFFVSLRARSTLSNERILPLESKYFHWTRQDTFLNSPRRQPFSLDSLSLRDSTLALKELKQSVFGLLLIWATRLGVPPRCATKMWPKTSASPRWFRLLSRWLYNLKILGRPQNSSGPHVVFSVFNWIPNRWEFIILSSCAEVIRYDGQLKLLETSASI